MQKFISVLLVALGVVSAQAVQPTYVGKFVGDGGSLTNLPGGTNAGFALGSTPSGSNGAPGIKIVVIDASGKAATNSSLTLNVLGAPAFDASALTNATPLAQIASPNTVLSSNQVSQVVSNSLGGVLPFTIGPGMTPGSGALQYAMYMTNHWTAYDTNGVPHASYPSFDIGPRQDQYGNGWNVMTVSKDLSELSITNPPWTFTNGYTLMVRSLWPAGTNTVAGEPGGHAQENAFLCLGQNSGDASGEFDAGGHMNACLDIVTWGDQYGYGQPSTVFPTLGMWMYFYGTNSTTQPIQMTIEGTPAGGLIESIASLGNPASFQIDGPYAHYGDTAATSGGKYISLQWTGDATVGSRAYIGGYTTNSDGQIFLSGNYLGAKNTVLIDVGYLGNLSVVPPTGATVSIGAFASGGTSMVNVDGNVTVGTNAYQGGVAPANGLLVEGGIVSSNAVTAAQFNGSAAGLTNIYSGFPFAVSGAAAPTALAQFSYAVYGWQYAGAGGGGFFACDTKPLRAGLTNVVLYFQTITTNAGTFTATVYNTITTNTFGATVGTYVGTANPTWIVTAGTNSTLVRVPFVVPFNVATNAMGMYATFSSTMPVTTNVFVVAGSSRQDIQ